MSVAVEMRDNPYLPHLATLEEVVQEAPGIMTFRANFNDGAVAEGFQYKPGQFVEVSVFGVGECPFGLARGPDRDEPVTFSVARMGKVTAALHRLRAGDVIGIRGPYGNGFPVEDWRGKNLHIIAGGIGLPPLRTVVEHALDHRDDFGEVNLVYGARSPELLVYKDALKEWEADDRINLFLTVDKGDETWDGHEGFVPQYCEELGLSADNAIACTVGPPIMIFFVVKTLTGMGFADDQLIGSLEARMKCGVGKCGRCNAGPKMICLDGPVFSYRELKALGQME
jgi:sulfhydrogenase subunit gamma (sulfur reductase)